MEFENNEYGSDLAMVLPADDDWLTQAWEMESEGLAQQREVLALINDGGYLVMDRAC